MQYSAIQLKATATAVPALRATALVVRAGGMVATLKLMAETTAAALAMAVAAPQLSMAVQAQLLKATALTGYFLKFIEKMDQFGVSDATAFRLQRAFDDLAEVADEARITAGKGLSDGSSLDDAYILSINKGLADTIGFTDAIVMAMDRHIDEPVYIDDPIGKKLITSRFDSFGVGEGPGIDDYATNYFLQDYTGDGRPAIQVGKGFTDFAGQFSDQINYINVVKGLTEQLTLTETFARHMRRTLTDSITATDDVDGNLATDDEQTMQYRKAVTELFSVGDTTYIVVSFVRTFSEQATVADAARANMLKVLTETTGLSEQALFRFNRPVADTSTASDAAINSVRKPAADSTSVSDTGSLRMQSYCDITYFAGDYVGTSLTF